MKPETKQAISLITSTINFKVLFIGGVFALILSLAIIGAMKIQYAPVVAAPPPPPTVVNPQSVIYKKIPQVEFIKFENFIIIHLNDKQWKEMKAHYANRVGQQDVSFFEDRQP